MKKIEFGDLTDQEEYEKIRPVFLKDIISLKKNRRIQLGENISLVFENRDTVKFQIQEMIRTENIADKHMIVEEIETYNDLIPGVNEISATMFIEIDDEQRIKEKLEMLQGINTPEAIYINIDNKYRIPAIFEKGRSDEHSLSSVQYVRFKFSVIELGAFKDNIKEANFVVNHLNYNVTKKISDNLRKSMLDDLC